MSTFLAISARFREKHYKVRLIALLYMIVMSLACVVYGQDTNGLTNPLNGVPTTVNNPGVPDPYDTTGDQRNLDNYPLDRRGVAQFRQRQTLDDGANLTDEEFDQYRQRRTNRGEFKSQGFQLLPPDPPTEFQKLVLSSTGKFLPVYGAQLFRNAPTTFAPLDRVPVTPEYLIGPGDELLIQVWGQITLNSHFLVDRAGNIYIPQVGTMRVAGLSFGQLRDDLKTQISRIFRNFDLNVNMGELRSIQVFVVGQARRPGSYTVSSLSTLVNALFVTGGPSPQGSLRNVQLKRAGKVIASFDLYDLLERGDKSGDVQLLPGDVIYIPPVGPQVAVAGTVNTPAIYELKPGSDTTVEEILQLAAGPSSVASSEKVRLERIDDHRMRSVTDLALDAKARAGTLRDGDILELVPVIDRFKNGVTLRGNVANPGHYGWHPGMRVGELFPDRDALITRDYWLKRGRLGLPVLTYVPVCKQKPRRTTDVDSNQFNTNRGRTDYDKSSAQLEPMRGQNEDTEEEGCVEIPEDSTMESQPVNTRNSYDSTSRSGAQERVTQDQYNLTDQNQRTNFATQSATAASAMIERAPGQFQPRNDVKLSAPDIDWGYAVIERQNKDNLTTSLLSFSLGGLVLNNDSSQNLELQPGDVVTIFSKADIRVPQSEQTRFVHLEGEFRSAGVYSVLPGETLKDLVKRAGGFTKDAYLYGSEFTRESTRRVQQQRLNEYVNQIALQASTNSANSANRSISALDTAASAAAASQSQAVISNLRQARATGRIVLELRPGSDSISQLPAIALEDGDRFIVPHVPSTVSVTGAVYNPNSFLYDGQRRLRDYLKLAGGRNRDADAKSSYVIRADGSVVSRRQVSAWHRDGFETLRVYPGDTVVVPLNLNKGTGLRNVVDIAQIVGQFGVAAAAANLVF